MHTEEEMYWTVAGRHEKKKHKVLNSSNKNNQQVYEIHIDTPKHTHIHTQREKKRKKKYCIVCYFLINRKVLCKVINKYYVFAVTNTHTQVPRDRQQAYTRSFVRSFVSLPYTQLKQPQWRISKRKHTGNGRSTILFKKWRERERETVSGKKTTQSIQYNENERMNALVVWW